MQMQNENNSHAKDANDGNKSKILNLNKIKNIIYNDKERENNIKIIPIEKKIFSIIKKFTTKVESEVVKEFLNYKLILNNFKKNSKSNELKNKINAFYYILLNKLDKNL